MSTLTKPKIKFETELLPDIGKNLKKKINLMFENKLKLPEEPTYSLINFKDAENIESRVLKFLGKEKIDDDIEYNYINTEISEDYLPKAPSTVLLDNTSATLSSLNDRFQKLKYGDLNISERTNFERDILIDQHKTVYEMNSNLQENFTNIKDFLEKESVKLDSNTKMQEIQLKLLQDLSSVVLSIKEENKLLKEEIKLINTNKTDSVSVTSNNEKLMQLTRKGVKVILKQAIVAPIRILNIVVFAPAGDAFWHIFGKWAYFLWGLLMLLLLIILSFSILISLNKSQPYLFELFYRILSYIYIYFEIIYTPIVSVSKDFTYDAIDILKNKTGETMFLIKENAFPKIYEGSVFIIKQGAYYVKVSLFSILNEMINNLPFGTRTIAQSMFKPILDGSSKKNIRKKSKKNIRKKSKKNIRKKSKKNIRKKSKKNIRNKSKKYLKK